MFSADSQEIRGRTVFLERNGADAAGPFDKCGIAHRDVAGEGPDCREAQVAGLHRAAAVLFQMAEEGCHAVGGQIFDREPLHCLAAALGHEGQQQRQAVPITLQGIDRQIALGREVFHEEALDPCAESGVAFRHGLRPLSDAARHPGSGFARRSARTGGWPRRASPGSSICRPGWPPRCRGRDRLKAPAGAFERRPPRDARRSGGGWQSCGVANAGRAPGIRVFCRFRLPEVSYGRHDPRWPFSAATRRGRQGRWMPIPRGGGRCVRMAAYRRSTLARSAPTGTRRLL